MAEFNYEKEVEINPNALDIEWLQQPSLFLKYSEAAAEARRDLDLAKERLDVIRAQIDKEIREDPEKFGVKKITEAVVSNTIVVQEKYRQVYQEYVDLKYQADLLTRVVSAFDQRKSALENLVRLYGQSYFAGPQEPRDLGMEWEKKIKERSAQRKIRRRLKRNVK